MMEIRRSLLPQLLSGDEVFVQSTEFSADLASTFDFKSARDIDAEFLVVRFTRLDTPSLVALPIAYIQPFLAGTQASLDYSVMSPDIRAMSGLRFVLSRAWLDPDGAMAEAMKPSPPLWGIRANLINRCARARCEIWRIP
jgi:hypothetical protein